MTVTRTGVVGCTAAFLAGAAVYLLGEALLTPGEDAPVRTSFRDPHGRVCTQVVWRDTVALDCEFRGFGASVGGWFNDLPTPAPKPSPTKVPTIQLIPNWK